MILKRVTTWAGGTVAYALTRIRQINSSVKFVISDVEHQQESPVAMQIQL